jgi:hypothetical protein
MKGCRLFAIYDVVVAIVQRVGLSLYKGFHKKTQQEFNPIPDQTIIGVNHVAEFAKRVFVNGREITVVPTDEVFTSFEEPSQFPELLRSLKRRGYPEIKMTDLPALTNLCYHKKLALLLATAPSLKGPNPIQEKVTLNDDCAEPLKSLIWFKPGFDVQIYKDLFVKELKGQLIATLASVMGNVSAWITYSMTDGNVKVKGWDYYCESQGLLIFLIAERAKKLISQSLDDTQYAKLFDRNWELELPEFKEIISNVQVVFEIAYFFKEGDINRETSKGYFTNYLVSKVVREVNKQLAASESVARQLPTG